MSSAVWRGAGRGVLALVAVFLYLPVLVLVVYSFHASRLPVGWQGLTLGWYGKLLSDPELHAALRNTVIVAGASTLISTALGTALALGLRLHRTPGAGALRALFQLPIVFPDIVMALALLASFVLLGVPLGLGTIVLAHVSFQVSFVWMVVDGALEGFPLEVLEAARDLGADRWRALRLVALPLVAPAVLAGALIAFTLSVDDFVMAYFTQGSGSATLAVRIYSMLRRGVTPDVNALCAAMLAFSVGTMWAAEALLGSSREGRSRVGLPALVVGLLLLALVALGLGGGRPEAAPPGADAFRAHGLTWSRRELGDRLNLFIYTEYMDPGVLAEFQATYGVRVVQDYYETNEALIAKLQAGGAGLYDVVVPAGYGVEILRGQGLLQPLDHTRLPNLGNLMPRFVDPPYDPGNRYTVSYMWGTTGLGVRRDLLPAGAPVPDSWAVLFDPAHAVGPFSMIDDQREALGAALKYLGFSMNSRDPAELRAAEELLVATRKRSLTWAGSSPSRDLLARGDVVVQQNYGGDVAQVAAEVPDILYILPKEGASIWSDNLAVPRDAPHPAAAHAFLNFLMDPGVAARLANYTSYATPNALALPQVDATLRDDPAFYPPPELMERLEFVQDLGEATRLYTETWTRVKASGG